MRTGLDRRKFLVFCSGIAARSLFASTSRLVEDRRVSLAAISKDPLRPQYHLLPAANWMNDPNGPIYWNGNYHIFYQYNPGGAKWGDMHWAHAVSPDMIHWRHMPVAVSPRPNGPDRDGCFSGSTIIHNGIPTILYTGVRSTSPENATLRDGTHNFHESQCLAICQDPELRWWTTLPAPVIASPPIGMTVTGFRDPCVWKDGSWWYMALGSGISKKGGCVLLYRSRSLRSWEYLHPLIVGRWNGESHIDPVDSGEMWECPDFFELDGQHVLLYSTERKVSWLIGQLDRASMTFHPQSHGLLDTGAFYAPKSMLDEHGRRVLWGWIPETRPESQYEQAGWAGSMALPRVLKVNCDNMLEIRPLPELQSLRLSDQGRSRSFNAFRGEVIATTFGPGSIRLGSELHPYVTIVYSSATPLKVSIDGKDQLIRSSLDGVLSIHIFMDGSIIEVFINNAVAHTKRVYDLNLASMLTPVSIMGDTRTLVVRELSPISRNRLTT